MTQIKMIEGMEERSKRQDLLENEHQRANQIER
jgi:hypothetical protein